MVIFKLLTTYQHSKAIQMWKECANPTYLYCLFSSTFLIMRSVCISFLRFFFSWRSGRRSCSSTWISNSLPDDHGTVACVFMQYFLFMTVLFAFQTYFKVVCILVEARCCMMHIEIRLQVIYWNLIWVILHQVLYTLIC